VITPAFQKKIDMLDLAGLEALRCVLIVRQETRRIAFGKSRSVTAGDAYKKTSAELGAVRAVISLRKE
jgi:hypothetical protein